MKDDDLELALTLDVLTLVLFLFQTLVSGIPVVGELFAGFVAILTSLVFFGSILYAVSMFAGFEETVEAIGSAAGLTAGALSVFSGVAFLIVVAVLLLTGLVLAAFLSQTAWIPAALIGWTAANPGKARRLLSRGT